MKATVALMITVALLTSGCMTTRHYVSANSVHGAQPVTADNSYFISGLGQTKAVSAAQVCGGIQRVAATETHTSPLNILLGVVTLGIYTPQEHTVYCR